MDKENGIDDYNNNYNDDDGDIRKDIGNDEKDNDYHNEGDDYVIQVITTLCNEDIEDNYNVFDKDNDWMTELIMLC